MGNKNNSNRRDESPAIMVSCIIATRNRRQIVDRAIESVLAQTCPITDLLIVDDASSDGTYAYLNEKYSNNPHIRIVRNYKQTGPAATRNRALDLALGKYVSFLDDDDQWQPEKIEKQMVLAEQGYDLVTMTRTQYAINGKSISTYGPTLQKVTLNDLFKRNVVISVSPLVKTSLMRKVQFDPNLWCGEDYDAWIRLLKADATTVNINDPLIVLHKNTGASLNQMRKNKFYGRKQIYKKHKALMNSREKMLFLFMTVLKLILPDPRYQQKRIQQFIRTLI